MKRNKTNDRTRHRYIIAIIIILAAILLFQNACGLIVETLREPSSVSDINAIQQEALNTNGGQTISGAQKNNEDGQKTLYLVTRVIDGDTIIVENKSSVRLIGINAPETGMYFFEEAKQYLEFLVDNKKVYFESDITDKDKYGRLLRYVFDENFFINYEMVKSGFANAFDYKPDSKYSDLLKQAEKYAKENQKGIWERASVEGIEVKINYDAKGKDELNLNGEWVEIINKGTDKIKLNGWTVKDLATNIYTFKDIILYPKTRIFLFTGKGEDKDNKLYWKSDRPIWNNDHDTLYLRNNKGKLVAYISY